MIDNRYIFLHILPSQLSAKDLLASACKQLQAVSLQVPDSRFKIQKELLESRWNQDSRFKIFRDFSWIQGPGFKIQDSRSKKNFLNPTSWFQRGVARVWIQEVLFESWILNPGPWVQEKSLEILNLESTPSVSLWFPQASLHPTTLWTSPPRTIWSQSLPVKLVNYF